MKPVSRLAIAAVLALGAIASPVVAKEKPAAPAKGPISRRMPPRHSLYKGHPVEGLCRSHCGLARRTSGSEHA